MNEWIKNNHNLRVNPKKEPKRNKQKADKINKNKAKSPKIQLSKMITNHNKSLANPLMSITRTQIPECQT